jgi:uncharacterized protein YqgC (DUF456 family)
MSIVLIVVAFLFLIAGIFGAVIPGLPGPPLSFIGLLLLKLSGHGEFSTVFLIIWAVITIAVTVMDYILPSILARKFGGSKAAAVGSFIGLVVGLFVFPPWGMIVGPFIGAFIGELLYCQMKTGKKQISDGSAAAHDGEPAAEKPSDNARALKAALGAFLAFLVGSGAKLITGSLMLFYAIGAMF